MTTRTAAFFQALARAPLLAHVGEPLPDGVHASLVDSWRDALARSRQDAWKEIKLDVRGDLTSFLAHQHRDRDRDWNRITAELRPRVLELATPACQVVVQAEAFRKPVLAAVSWDLLAAGMEYEYADLQAPGLYDRLASIYLLGRFPCGWRGDYPQGSLEIF